MLLNGFWDFVFLGETETGNELPQLNFTESLPVPGCFDVEPGYKLCRGVYLDNSESINAALVRHGFAWWYRTYSRDSTYELIESSARTAHAGLWQSPAPVHPWEYSKVRKK